MDAVKNKNFRTRCLAKVLAVAMVVGCIPVTTTVFGVETDSEETGTVLTYAEVNGKMTLGTLVTNEKADKAWEDGLLRFTTELEEEGCENVSEAFDVDDMVYVGGESGQMPQSYLKDNEVESVPLELYDGEGGEHYLWRYCKAERSVDETSENGSETTKMQTEFYWVRTSEKVELEAWENATEDSQETEVKGKEEQNEEETGIVTLAANQTITVGTGGTYATLKEAVDAAPDSGVTEILVVSDIATTAAAAVGAKNIVVRSENGAKITSTTAIDVFTLTTGSITFEDVTIDGGSTNVNHRIVNATGAGAAVTLGSGAVVQNWYSAGYGAFKMYYTTADTPQYFTMKNGSKIVNCKGTTSYGSGGIVHLGYGNKTVVMESGSLIDTYTAAGGAFVFGTGKGNSSFKMEEGAVITNGTSNQYGGAITVIDTSSTINIAGDITNCTGVNGGAIYNIGASNTITVSGDISGCTATTNGGAIYAQGNFGSLTVDGNISDCEATGTYGGAIAIYGATSNADRTIKINGKISGCTSKTYGGAIAIYSMAYTTLTLNGNITECEATTYGGGIATYSVSNSTLTLNGNITNCKAATYGGAYYSASDSNNTITMSENASVKGCTAGSAGGGFYLLSGGTISNFVMKAGAVIDDCHALGVHESWSTNKPYDCAGGGIYHYSGHILTIGGTIKNCSAARGGGIEQATDTGSAWHAVGATDYAHTVIEPTALFENCSATGHWDSHNGTVGDVLYGVNDYCPGQGGAISLSRFSQVDVLGGKFINCTADDGIGGAIGGYGHYIVLGDTDNETYPSFENCSARSGGAIVATHGLKSYGASINNCKAIGGGTWTNFKHSGYGGAIYIASNEYWSNIYDVTITNCSAAISGGAIYVCDNNGNLMGCYLANNSAGEHGGAIFIDQFAVNMKYASAKYYESEYDVYPMIVVNNTVGDKVNNIETSKADIMKIQGNLNPGSRLGITTVESSATTYNKKGAQFAGASVTGLRLGAFISDIDKTLTGAYGTGNILQWSDEYTVTYDGNTNDGGEAPEDVVFEKNIMLVDENGKRAEYMMAYDATYGNGVQVVVLGNDGNLKIEKGVYLPESDDVYNGNALTKNGYRFVGWSTEPGENGAGGSVVYKPGGTFIYNTASATNNNITLYAVWERVDIPNNCPLILDLTDETLKGQGGETATGLTVTNSSITVKDVDFSKFGCEYEHTHVIQVVGTTTKTVTMEGAYDTEITNVSSGKFSLNTTGKLSFTKDSGKTNQFTSSEGPALVIGDNVSEINVEDGVIVLVATQSKAAAPIEGADAKVRVLDMSMYESFSSATTIRIAGKAVTVPKNMARVAVMDSLTGNWLTGDITVLASDGTNYVRGTAQDETDSNASDEYSENNVYGDVFVLDLGSNDNLGRYQEVRLPKMAKQMSLSVPTAIVFNIYADDSTDSGFVAPVYTLENNSYTCEDELVVGSKTLQFGKESASVDVLCEGVVVADGSSNDYTLKSFETTNKSTMNSSADKPIVCLDMTISNGLTTTNFSLDEEENSSQDKAAEVLPGANKLQLSRPAEYSDDATKRYYQVPRLITEEGYRTLKGNHTLSLGFEMK